MREMGIGQFALRFVDCRLGLRAARQADELGLIAGQPTVYLFHFPLEESVVCPGADLSSSSAGNVN